MATTKAIKDWTLDDFLNEMNENMTIEKGKLFSTQKYQDANESDRHYMIWTDAEKPVYEKFGQLLIDNTIETNGQFSFGQCRVEPNTHEMKNPRLYCNGYYYILTKFGSYNDWLHDAVKNYENGKVQAFLDSVSVGDIIHKPMGKNYNTIPYFHSCYEVVKKNNKSLVIKELNITKLNDVEEVEEPYFDRFENKEMTRTRLYTHATVHRGDYDKGFNGEWWYGNKTYYENLFKISIKFGDNFEIEKADKATLRLEIDGYCAERLRQKAAC